MQLLLRVRTLLILNNFLTGKEKLVLICSCLMSRKRSEKPTPHKNKVTVVCTQKSRSLFYLK